MPSSQQDGRGAKGPLIPRGFASMDPERQREVASEDGRASQEQGAARGARPEPARSAGSKASESASAQRKPAAGSGG